MWWASVALGQLTSIQSSPHNLSAGGKGNIRASNEQEVCIFCHTTHNAAAVQPLWNRSTPVIAYTVYTSSSLKAKPGQPTGSSKLCLSCHDGTIALGDVLSRPEGIKMAKGVTRLPSGHFNLGTDLSNDHPISFVYDKELATQNPRLNPPSGLVGTVRLDAQQELQCTACHDPHDNSRKNFLVMDNSRSQLCLTCHNMGTTTVTQHQDCVDCHQSHSAPGGPHLLKAANETQTCLLCHSGQPGQNQGQNVAPDLSKPYHHDTNSPNDLANRIPNASACTDCHEAHSIKSGLATAPLVPADFGNIGGISTGGAPVLPAHYEYEVCFKCHADQAAQVPMISRSLVQTNLRLQFSQTAVSFHPVEGAGRNADVPSLAPGFTPASLIYCMDCHNSDSSAAAGATGYKGPHGSNNPGLLSLSYSTIDNTPESAAAYALCYRCHQRSSLIANITINPNQAFPLHLFHVVNQKASCAACHDSHGISASQGMATHNSHLINFDTAIVRPDPVTGRLEYDTTGMRQGLCYLSCHGVAHSPKSYGNAAAAHARPAEREREEHGGGAPPRPTPPIPPPRQR
jgi:predicted CXXCH cytochrome family protein